MRKKITNSITELLERFYVTAKARYMWRMRRAFDASDASPILVLQMGKVGSMSVQAGLEEQQLPNRIYHVHFLSTNRTLQTERERRQYFRTDRHSDLVRPWLNQFLLSQFRSDTSGKRWKIVTLTREPVARNLSAFFENLAVTTTDDDAEYEIQSDYYGIDPVVVSESSPERLVELFFAHARHDSPVRFFDREIRDLFGIDALDEDFPKDKGYKIYQSTRADLLVLKLEKLKDCVEVAFEDFLNIRKFHLVNRNVGAKKIYAPLYDATKKNMKVSDEYANRLYESRYMTTFYSEAEIKAARERWCI
jgi:hypothetical protein